MTTPCVAAIHDMSGFGRCSLTVAIPILSAMGVQCCPLPTAFLSTHTGGFEGFTFLDMTDEMPKAARHWKSLGLHFSAVYSGFLGSARQITIVADIIRDFRGDGVVVVDPVMGDGGAVYRTYTPEMCAGMTHLAEQADVITPNLTEAALLLGIPYEKLPTGEAGCWKAGALWFLPAPLWKKAVPEPCALTLPPDGRRPFKPGGWTGSSTAQETCSPAFSPGRWYRENL